MRKNFFSNPRWIERYNYTYNCHDDIPQSVFDEINSRLDTVQSQNPIVTVAISAWNEEVDILKTVSSLASSKTQYPFEIIVVNNNSTDKTQQTLEKLHIRNAFQPIQGWGPGRQMGMEQARGKYILTGDSDCIYADCWIEKMVTGLKNEGVVSVYGRYSFISEKGFSRWQLTILEIFKDLIAEVRHVKRPFLNSYGMSMGYIREHAMKEGFYMNKTHGEDGRMCYDLMKYGTVKQIRSYDNRVWTGVRTLRKSGTFSQVLFKRIKKEISRFSIYFNTRMKYHPPKN
ncbi:MAG: glycosyltransferase family 2 protein [Chitinophagaceae bacterium]|nr:MAG: glycosyltransferase family 2 protein [Chitinophagaceae bacterium]